MRRGVDVEMRHVDVCPQLDLFAAERIPAPGAERAARAIQVPVHASLTDRQMRRVTAVVRKALEAGSPRSRPQAPEAAQS
jgi:dTDP-4-amino-4,6-dideoxygalactose transaminase